MVAVEIELEPTFAIVRASVVFENPRYQLDTGNAQSNPEYDVFPDGSALVMIEEGAPLASLQVVLNWFEELTRLVPTN